MTVLRSLLILALIALHGCGDATDSSTTTPPKTHEITWDLGAAAEVFAEIEERLYKAQSLRLEWDVRAEGALEAELKGKLELDAVMASVRGEGSFKGKDQSLLLVGDGETLRGRSSIPGTLEVPQPKELRDALLVGLMRMGILHNLAMLTSNVAPDRSAGGVREWVETVEHSWGDENKSSTIEGRVAVPLDFGIVVDGDPVANARLWIDVETRLPLRREQNVEFPGGTMKVVEIYSACELAATIDAGSFKFE